MTTMAPNCRALSLIKGIEFEEGGPILISNMIKDAMGGMDVSVLMGANVANEGARGGGRAQEGGCAAGARPEACRRPVCACGRVRVAACV